MKESTNTNAVATLASGCFWCTEAVFERVEGVEKVVSGYTGGHVKNPSYREVTTGRTGHAEACQIYFDQDIVSYEALLDIFFHTHDPTTLNRQGNDVGPQYRSAIFFHDEEQKKTAEKAIAELNKSGEFRDPIVTEINAFSEFFEAENYHQDYFANNPNQPYCVYVVQPKVNKLKATFQDKLK